MLFLHILKNIKIFSGYLGRLSIPIQISRLSDFVQMHTAEFAQNQSSARFELELIDVPNVRNVFLI